jgi:hypothetical protein
MGHSMIVLGELDAANARQVDRLFTDADMFDLMRTRTLFLVDETILLAKSAVC